MTLFFFIFLIMLVAVIVRLYLRDRRYLKKRTSEAMRKEVWEELEKEVDDLQQRQQKFQTSLGAARQNLDAKKDDW